MRATQAVGYSPTVTIRVPTGIGAQDFEVGIAQNLVKTRREVVYVNGKKIVTDVSVPINPAVALNNHSNLRK